MRLSVISVQNFRAFRDAEITLPEAGLALIAGANNSGKSALLSAFDVIAGNPAGPEALRHAGSTGPVTVTATFTLDEDDRHALLAAVASAGELTTRAADQRLQFAFEEVNGQGPRLVWVGAVMPSGSLAPFARSVWAADEKTSYVEVASAVDGGDPSGNLMTPIRRFGGGDRRFWLDDHMERRGLSAIWALMGTWRSHFYHFQALRPGTKSSMPLDSARRLEPTGENLPALLLDLRTNRPDHFDELSRVIAQIVPGIGQLAIRTWPNGTMSVTFETLDVELNLKSLGTGVEQLLLTLVVGLTEAPPFTLVIEEPETNLHPGAQRALLGWLNTWATDRLVVVATHSPVMLDWSPGGNHLLLVERDEGASRVRSVGEDGLSLLASLGVRPSDVLAADRVLVVEGPTDEDVLAAWFPDLLKNPRVAVLHGEGGDNALHADRLAKWLAGADRFGLRRVLYIRDRDELSAPVLGKLIASPSVYVLKQRELENYLLHPEAVALVVSRLLPNGTPPPNVLALGTYGLVKHRCSGTAGDP